MKDRMRLYAALSALIVACSTLLGVTFQSAAQARSGLKIGLTVQASEYAHTFALYEDQGVNIDVMRVFSSSGPPPWSDTRIQQLKARGVIPFISWKTYDVTATRNWLLAMPADIPLVYLAYCHECEADMDAATYKARQVALWDMIVALPSNIRAKTRFGPIQTKQWTENTAGRSYSTYDPGIGDFWGVDAYVNSWGAGGATATSYPDHIAWLNKIQTYNTCRDRDGNPGYCRKKWLPELGAVSLPYDTNDFARATWLNRVAQRIEDDTSIQVVIWWDTEGTGGGSLPGLGTRRNFRLDERTTYNDSTGTYTTTTPSPPETRRVWTEFMQRNTP